MAPSPKQQSCAVGRVGRTTTMRSSVEVEAGVGCLNKRQSLWHPHPSGLRPATHGGRNSSASPHKGEGKKAAYKYALKSLMLGASPFSGFAGSRP
jgi:hypothetical protein